MTINRSVCWKMYQKYKIGQNLGKVTGKKRHQELSHTFWFINILEEIRDLTANEIGRNWDIGQVLRNLSRHWKLSRNWADIGQTIDRHLTDIGVLHISYRTFCIPYVR